jgi:hypothetical protein
MIRVKTIRAERQSSERATINVNLLPHFQFTAPPDLISEISFCAKQKQSNNFNKIRVPRLPGSITAIIGQRRVRKCSPRQMGPSVVNALLASVAVAPDGKESRLARERMVKSSCSELRGRVQNLSEWLTVMGVSHHASVKTLGCTPRKIRKKILEPTLSSDCLIGRVS